MQQTEQLGRYQLLDRIAFGGMAEIYRAKTFDDQGNVHWVAVKRVLRNLCTDGEFLRMLIDEAKVSALLSHPNIARVYEFAHVGGDYFITMEFVDGKDLRALLEKRRARKAPLSAAEVAWIGIGAARALDAAHSQHDRSGNWLHLVHRDVSPSNILLSYTGEVKLCDFGIAKATLNRVQTQAGVIKGKVKYMSPEQTLGSTLDGRSDLFSLGSVLYEAATLIPPFMTSNETDTLRLIRSGKRADPSTLQPSTPAALNAIINRLHARQAAERFSSGAELERALTEFLQADAPSYRRSHFARLMRDEFSGEIEQELRTMEEYVVHEADPQALGENLIADVLDKEAPFRRFAPSDGTQTTAHDGGDATRKHAVRSLHHEPTRLLRDEQTKKL